MLLLIAEVSAVSCLCQGRVGEDPGPEEEEEKEEKDEDQPRNRWQYVR